MIRKPLLGNSLAELNPELAKEWHPTENGDLTPYDVTPGSGKKVWWKCDKGDDHKWESSVANRSKGRGCAICRGFKVVHSNCLVTLNPELSKQWHPTKNGSLTPFDVTVGSDKRVWWKCDKGDDHEWEASVGNRHNLETGCPIFSGKKILLL